MLYNIIDIAEIINGSFLNPTVFEEEWVEHIVLDSRSIAHKKYALFFALIGKRNDGHQFIADAYQAGIRHFVVSSAMDISNYPKANFIQVKDSLEALQALATYHRKEHQLKVIGITGSNGKTIIKEWLGLLLAPDFTIVKSPKSYNSQVGVPLSVWQLDDGYDLGIFEAGISQTGEMKRLAPMIDCEIGLFTNLGAAHSRGFKDDEEKIQEKIKLFEPCKTIIYRVDDARVPAALKQFNDKQHFTWSTKSKADLQITHTQKGGQRSVIQAVYQQKKIEITVPFTDEAYLENSVHCWAMLLHLGIPQAEIERRVATLEAVPLRLELKAAINNCTLINDSYNADLNSLHIALDFLSRQTLHEQKILILSDILQSGQEKEKLYATIANLIIASKINQVIGIGHHVTSLRSNLPSSIETLFYSKTEDFLHHFYRFSFKNSTILLKGARKYAFERIASLLEKKAHQTVLEINLSALAHNLNVYRSSLKSGTKMMVMVKAAAYGSGSVEVARLLEYQKVDYLAVAYTDEGVELREAGIQLPIMVLNPEEAGFESMIRHRLEPEIYSLSLLEKFAKAVQQQQPSLPYPIHINLDTGMRRLGFENQHITNLEKALKELSKQIKVGSIFSHLAGSEDGRHDEFTQHQFQLFRSMSGQLIRSLGYRPLRHMLNSGGIVRFPEQQFDMVRLGIGVYGVDASGEFQNRLQVVSTLKATISQIKELQPKETVGYGRAGKALLPTRIGTISIGYADGFSRQLSQGKGHVLLYNQLAPVIGNVCMDMSMIDLSELPQAKEGDEVVIFGEQRSILEYANDVGTIPYEVLTAISGRVKRIYFQE